MVKAGIAVAPHAAAARSAVAVLADGGNAIEAMVAAAATIAVVYPHMNGLGGDAFWLIHEPGRTPRSIDACGPAGAAVSADFYRAQGLDAIPSRGPLAANTVAGTVAGWDLALALSHAEWGGRLPLSRLLAEAIAAAEDGFPATRSQRASTLARGEELAALPGFAGRFLPAPVEGESFVQRPMAATLRWLAAEGLDDFYRGSLAREIATGLRDAGSPLALADLEGYRAEWREPLALAHSRGTLYNMAPPTQGVVSLMILGIVDRLGAVAPESADYVHAIVEATKQAFGVRDRYLTDPKFMKVEAGELLAEAALAKLVARIDPALAKPWGARAARGDTVWLGVIDGEGRSVSFIQSLYHEFGSGIVLEATGLNWQNRGCSFSLDPDSPNALAPGRKPFHTLNPALALLDDGTTLVYGTMGGDGQPQTQAAVFTRHVVHGMPLQEAVAAPRWLLGRTWGSMSDSLKLESRFDPALVVDLRRRGHDVELVGAYDEVVGHAGALRREAGGRDYEGGADPRSDGAVATPQTTRA